MNTMETRRYAMLVRVKDFGEAHRDLFPESTAGGRAFAAVAAAVAQLSGHTVSKLSTARDGLRAKAKAREALVERLDKIGRTARAIAEETPGFDDPFRLPRKQSDEALLMTGRMFVQEAEALRDRFIGHSLPETFVADLTGVLTTFEEAIRHTEAGRSARASAQAGIAEALLDGLAAVRQLDVIVPNQLAGKESLLAGWERDRRVEYPHRMRRVAPVTKPASDGSGPVTPPPPVTPPVPATTVAPVVGEPNKPVTPDVTMKVAS